MDKRLVLTTVFVTLSWMFMGSYAQSTTMDPDASTPLNMATSNMTASNMTASNMTAHNMTASNMTAPNMTAHNMTASNMTAPNMTAHNMTASNMTASNMTAPNMTAHNMTASNMTASNMTAPNMTAPNMTMAPPTVPPLKPNNTVVALVENITNAGCGTEQLCGSQPASCNPNVPGECFFVAARRENGRNFGFGLSGESDGYLAATLSTGSELAGNDTTYICANNNGTIQFFGALLNNGQLTLTNLSVNNVKGRVNGNRIQCTFSATLPDGQSGRGRATEETFALRVSTGPFNSTSGDLGSPTVQFRGSPTNLANPNATITNLNNASATTPATPPLEFNNTVVALVENITNTGCGTQQLCGSQPDSCDPNVAGECFFVATRQESGRNFGFSLSGESDGYLAASVSTDTQLGGNDSTYICANNNGTIQFFSALLDNGQLNLKNLSVNNVKGRVNGNRIQCTFSATLPEQTARAENFALGISSGPFNSTSGTLGSPNVQFRSAVVNLANPNATITNLNNANATTNAPAGANPAGTTPASTTSSSPAIAPQQLLTQALLITVGVLSSALL